MALTANDIEQMKQDSLPCNVHDRAFHSRPIAATGTSRCRSLPRLTDKARVGGSAFFSVLTYVTQHLRNQAAFEWSLPSGNQAIGVEAMAQACSNGMVRNLPCGTPKTPNQMTTLKQLAVLTARNVSTHLHGQPGRSCKT